MHGEYHSITNEYSFTNPHKILIANADGEVIDNRTVNIPAARDEAGPELWVPANFSSILQGFEDVGFRPTAPLGDVILPDKPTGLIIEGGFDASVDVSTAIGRVAAHLEYNERVDEELEALERERENEARQRDLNELAVSPEDFLDHKIYERVGIAEDDDDESISDEEFYLTALSVIEDPYIQSIKGKNDLYSILSKEIRNYRYEGYEDPYSVDIIELESDKLIDKLVHSLDTASQEERRSIYDIIAQIEVPLELQERILWRMEEKSDYRGNSLAARYALNQYNQNGEGAWVKAQGKRQRLLKLLVSCSPEAAMKYFDDAMEQAHKIVFSSDPTSLPDGKVGMEFEGKSMWGGVDTMPISDEWDIGFDREVEVRKSYNSLSPSSYPAALVEFDAWGADNLVPDKRDSHALHRSRTMHMHLDRRLHSAQPMYGLFNRDLKRNDLGTWEIRGVMPFQSASETTAFMQLAIHSAAEGPTTKRPGKLSADNISSWQQLVYGHIVHSTKNADARVAALVALRDPYAMRAFDVSPLVETYGKDVLTLLHEQTDTFLVPDSVVHYKELYESSKDHKTPRNPQKLYDALLDPRTRLGHRREIISLMLSDPVARDHLIDLLRVDQGELKEKELYVFQEPIIERLSNASIDSARQLLALLVVPSIDLDIKKLIVGNLRSKPELFGTMLELLVDGNLPLVLGKELVSTLYYNGDQMTLIRYAKDGKLPESVAEYVWYLYE